MPCVSRVFKKGELEYSSLASGTIKIKGSARNVLLNLFLFWTSSFPLWRSQVKFMKRWAGNRDYKRLHGIRASISSMASSMRSENSSRANSFPQDLQITMICRQVRFNARLAAHSGQEIPGITLLNILSWAFPLGCSMLFRISGFTEMRD